MLKIFTVISTVLLMTLIFSSCDNESEKNIHELINDINIKYNYNFDVNELTIEKKENFIYHLMTDENTLITLYSNKENQIIQCTLSSFDINNKENFELFCKIGTELTNEEESSFKNMLINAEKEGRFTKNGWNVVIIKNQLGITYLVNEEHNSINDNQLPTVKKPSNNKP